MVMDHTCALALPAAKGRRSKHVDGFV